MKHKGKLRVKTKNKKLRRELTSDERIQERLYEQRQNLLRQAQEADRDESPVTAARLREQADGCIERAISENRGSW